MATLIFLIGALLGVIMINLAGLVLVMNKIFGLTPISIVITGIVVVTVYSYFGGLTTSAVTGTFNTLLLGVGSSVVVLFALAKAGGAELVFNEVQAARRPAPEPVQSGHRSELRSRPGARAADQCHRRSVVLAAGLGDQAKDLGRSFLWAGVWFYPIPLALGLLGFIGVAYGVTLDDLGRWVPGAIGPHVIASLGLPVFIIALYTLVVVNACFAAIDGALSGSHLVGRGGHRASLLAQVSERRLLTITKTSMIVAAAIAGGVVLTGIDYVNLVTTVYFYGTSLLIPVTLSIFWSRMTGAGYVAGVHRGHRGRRAAPRDLGADLRTALRNHRLDRGVGYRLGRGQPAAEHPVRLRQPGRGQGGASGTGPAAAQKAEDRDRRGDAPETAGQQ